jgi:hypothetical protein
MKVTEPYLRSFHDAELGTISLDRQAKTFDLIFRRADGTKAGFAFLDVEALRTSEILLRTVFARGW